MKLRFSLAEAMLVVGVAAWGLNYTFLRYAIQHGVDPLVVQSLRWVLAGSLFAGITRRVEGPLRIGRRDLLALVGISAVGLGATQISNAYALRLAPASTVALVFGLLPVVMAVAAQLFGIERLRRRHWVGAAVSVAGVCLIAVGRGGSVGGNLGGILLALSNVVGFGVFSVMLFPYSARVSPLLLNTISVVVSAVVLAVSGAWQLAGQDWGAPSALAWAAVGVSAVVSLVGGNGIWFWAQKRVGPGRTGLYANLQPVFGVVFAVILLGETLASLEIVGGLVVGVGIVLARSRRGPPTVE